MIPNRPPICFNVSHRKQRKNMGKKIRIPKYNKIKLLRTKCNVKTLLTCLRIEKGEKPHCIQTNRLRTDFTLENIKVIRQWNRIFEVLKWRKSLSEI
jgi:hypothetical protein